MSNPNWIDLENDILIAVPGYHETTAAVEAA